MKAIAFARRALGLVRNGARLLWYVATRQYFSLFSAAVLAGALLLAVTSDSFHDRTPAGNASVRQNAGPRPTAQPPAPRRSVLFFVVEDEAQKHEMIVAYNSGFGTPFSGDSFPPDRVVYLIAGTVEEEAMTIDRLNFEEWVAQQNQVDMRVYDVRGRFDGN